MIVLDFIALHDAPAPPRRRAPTRRCGRRLRAAASRSGRSTSSRRASRASCSTTTRRSFEQRSPPIDLIDFDYPCWQKLCDDLSQVSRTNLARVGATVLELLRSERLLK